MAQLGGTSILLKAKMHAAVAEVAKEMGLFDLKITAAMAIGKGNNFSGDVYRIKVAGVREDGRKDVLSFILKTTTVQNSKTPEACVLVHAYTREIFTYRELFPIFRKLEKESGMSTEERFSYPTYYTASDEAFNEFIVLGDLAEEKFKLWDKYKPLDFQHVSLVLKSLAKFHALSFAMKQKDEAKFVEFAEKCIMRNTCDKFNSYSKLTIDLATELIDDEVYKIRMGVFGETIIQRWEQMDDPKNMAPYNVLCHGDCWINNFMFKYKDDNPVEVKILDWQNLKPSSPVLDLVHMLSMSVDEEFRKMYFPRVFDVYYDSLTNFITKLGYNIENIYPRQVYDDHLKEFFPIGLLIVINAFPFVMSDKDTILDLKDFIEDHSGSLKAVKFSKMAQDRIRGVITDYITMNFL